MKCLKYNWCFFLPTVSFLAVGILCLLDSLIWTQLLNRPGGEKKTCIGKCQFSSLLELKQAFQVQWSPSASGLAFRCLKVSTQAWAALILFTSVSTGYPQRKQDHSCSGLRWHLTASKGKSKSWTGGSLLLGRPVFQYSSQRKLKLIYADFLFFVRSMEGLKVDIKESTSQSSQPTGRNCWKEKTSLVFKTK